MLFFCCGENCRRRGRSASNASRRIKVSSTHISVQKIRKDLLVRRLGDKLIQGCGRGLVLAACGWGRLCLEGSAVGHQIVKKRGSDQMEEISVSDNGSKILRILSIPCF